MEVITIESKAFKAILDKMERISADLQFCTQFIEKEVQARKNEAINKDWLEEKEVIKLFGISYRTLLRLRETQQIPYSRIGSSKVIYFLNDIKEYLKRETDENKK